VRIQLELEELNPDVPDSFIDALFGEFDDDGSGMIDDAEWEQLAAVLRQRVQDRQQQGDET